MKIQAYQSPHLRGFDQISAFLLRNYRIFTTEAVTIIRHISETNWRVFGIDGRVK
jgi:hypothetical protein